MLKLLKAIAAGCALLAFACQASPTLRARTQATADAGPSEPLVGPDAGSPVVIVPPLADAGAADAGTPAIDAGTADAGAPPIDPGIADAGTPDAGAADAGPTATPVDPGLLPATVAGWSPFAARSAQAPATSTATGSSGYVLNISGNGANAVYGGWTTHVTHLQGSAWYHFTGRAVPRNIVSLRESVTIVLRWSGTFGEEVAPDYVWNFQPQSDGSILFDRAIQSPPGTTAVDVQLILQWSPQGQIAFDRLSFTTVAAPVARKVRVAAIYSRPSSNATGLQSVKQAGQYADQVASTYKPDVMVLGEMLNVIGAPGTYDDDAETIPGPSTDYIAGIARNRRVNIVFGMVERVGSLLYNAAVLIDRNGNIAGKHHKVQLPLAEAGGGIAPGNAVEVFDTDFGKVALLICQETSFPEPAREAALQGAELLLVPIWGGRTSLVHARAVENGVYLAASGYDYKSEVVDPLGTVLASATIGGASTVAVADIDLAKRFRQDYLGDWRDISSKERRSEPYQYFIP